MQGPENLPWEEKNTGEEVAQAQGRHVLSATLNVMVFRVEDASFVVVGKRTPW